MPRMFCRTEYSQCKGKIIASSAGCYPISVFEYFRNKPSESSKVVNINNDFYNDLLKNKDNPTEEEYDSIMKLVEFLYIRLPKDKKHLVLRSASVYYSYCGAIVELEEGIVMEQSGDYINFHDHTNRSISYRGEMIQ